jgi:hypothetical protein
MTLKAMAAFGLALLVAALPVIPPEHVHEQVASSGGRALVHRHAVPHSPAHRHAASATVDDSDSVLTIDPLFTVVAKVYVAGPVLAKTDIAVDSPRNWSFRIRTFEAVPIHGPPRGPTQLRAPPSRSSLL